MKPGAGSARSQKGPGWPGMGLGSIIRPGHMAESSIAKNARYLGGAALLALAVFSVLTVPQDAFSTLTFTDYSNGTSTGTVSQGTNGTSGQAQQANQTGTGSAYPTNSTGTTNSTSIQTNSTSTQTISTQGTNQTSSLTNSTDTGSTSATNSNSTKNVTTNSTSTGNSTSTTSSTGTSSGTSQTNSTNAASDSTSDQSQSSTSESESPTQFPSSGSGPASSTPSSTAESSSTSEAASSPSIVVSAPSSNETNPTSQAVVSAGAPILPQGLYLTNDQQYYAYGDVVTLRADLPGISLQNIAIAVADPTGNDIVSRTVTTDANGTAQLQFKIPSNFETGVYQDIATAMVDGKNYTNSTEFNVIKTHGISIDSVQLVDQQGNPAPMIKKGQNNFVQVSISSGETMPALFTVNLFDTNQSSIGTASVKTSLKPGDSQMTLSFFIPPNAQVGTSDIFTDAYSDWPTSGGTPLTAESCLSASLEDPATLPVSYQPSQPQVCTDRPQNLAGTTLVPTQSKMTNGQATVMLGVAMQNDTMTFMDPTQAQLLALAYKNGTANGGDRSIALVDLNLADLNSTIANMTSPTTAVTNFTTLLGPSLQNDPMAQKILQEIQVSKRQVANIIGNETAAKINEELVQKQRLAAASQLRQDLTALAQSNVAQTPDASFASFLAGVPDNRTQQVFQGEFNFMKERVSAANAAMQNVLDSGGSWDQAVATFDSYAAVNHAQIVQINQNLNVQYGLADSNVQSCFDSSGNLDMVNGTNPCLASVEDNSTNSTGIKIVSVQPTDQNGNKVSLFTRGQGGFVRVNIHSGYAAPTLVTIDLFDSNLDTLGTSSAKYVLNPGDSEVVLPYYVPAQASTGLASIYADTLTDWPNKGGTSETHEISYFVGLS